ncbi:DUF6445 family protein [Alteromonas sp. ASW11-36]|uniref:DUF6445 family protein n=1 Tax=Alteromonas arenosi TaxID=3055817 RepID=A0ABT7SXX8_9ALTE|nr:DUF6445 family protein [Alteromonas sp. ASW11-36]MDM7860387.1 DUF6445 family protein [Alteromonas sp. ASW11-36]
MEISVNRAATPYFSKVGQEQTPVFILDNFLENLTPTLLSNLDQLSFDQAPTYYPGIRAKLPDEYMIAVAKALVPLLHKIYGIPADYQVEFFDSYYSLVTRKPHELTIEQQIPHFDGTEQFRFALLHYLNPHPHGGTAFYRHNASQTERVFEANVEQFLSSVSRQFEQNGGPKGQYIADTDSQFTKIGEIPFSQNRMAIYPGNLLHSGVINPATDIDASPNTGRLTANMFINFRHPM